MQKYQLIAEVYNTSPQLYYFYVIYACLRCLYQNNAGSIMAGFFTLNGI